MCHECFQTENPWFRQKPPAHGVRGSHFAGCTRSSKFDFKFNNVIGCRYPFDFLVVNLTYWLVFRIQLKNSKNSLNIFYSENKNINNSQNSYRLVQNRIIRPYCLIVVRKKLFYPSTYNILLHS